MFDLNFYRYYTGCPKSKVTILIFNNFLMKEVAWMKFSWYLGMILNFCLRWINLCKFTYSANGDYSGTTGDFPYNVTIQELIKFSNKRLFLCFPVLTRKWRLLINFLFCITMRIPTCTDTHILLVDMAQFLKITLIFKQSIQKPICIFFKFLWCQHHRIVQPS